MDREEVLRKIRGKIRNFGGQRVFVRSLEIIGEGEDEGIPPLCLPPPEGLHSLKLI